jgi:hypothetical protein
MQGIHKRRVISFECAKSKEADDNVLFGLSRRHCHKKSYAVIVTAESVLGFPKEVCHGLLREELVRGYIYLI